MISKKRILILGADGYDNVSINMERSFRQLGHEAERFFAGREPNNFYSFLYKFLVRSPFQLEAIKLIEKQNEIIGKNYLKKVESFKPDLIFIVHFNGITADQIKQIKEKYNIPVAWWIMGDEALISRFNPFHLNLYSYCSHLFIADTSWISTFKLIGDAKIEYLPFAADPYLYKILDLEKKFDISIVAAFGAVVPTVIHKGFILNKLAKSGFNVRAVTAGIKNYFSLFPDLAKMDVVDEVYLAPQVNELYNQTKIVLALNNPQAKSDPAVRVMEAAASRNFQIAEYRENTKKLMGDSVISFRSLDELTELLKFYLKNDLERERLAKKSYDLVLREHTTICRAQTVLERVF